MAQYMVGNKSGDIVSKNEKNFIKEALVNGQRIDGRGLFDYRVMKITFGKDYGQVQVQLGRTRVYVVTTCEVMEPFPDKPTGGFFTFNIEFSQMAAPEFDNSRLSAYGIELGRVVERGLRESRAIDTEALCIVAGSKVWSIRLDIHVLDHVGNLIDCCSIGAITALHHFRRPDVTIGEEVIIHSPEERDPVPLSIHHIPLCITFGIFVVNNETILVVDPLWKEEHVMKGRITMILNIHRELCGVQKAGGVPLEMDKILSAAKIAMVKVKELTVVIKNALQKDLVSRGKDIIAGPSESDPLMTTGIGIHQDHDGKIKFCDGRKSVDVKQENVDKHVPPSFSKDKKEKDFEEFFKSFGISSQTKIQEESDSEDDEEEGILIDEFQNEM